MNPKFSASSQRRLALAHPELQRIMNLARDQIAFEIDDSQRGRAAQEDAFREGNSKAHWGNVRVGGRRLGGLDRRAATHLPQS